MSARVDDRWHRKDRSRTADYGKGKRWQVVWTEPAQAGLPKKERKKSFANKDAAEKYGSKVRASIESGDYGKEPAPTVAAYYKKWYSYQVHQRESSLTTIRIRFTTNILPYIGEKPLNSVSRAQIQELVSSWQTTLAPATMRVAYRYLSNLFKTAFLDGLISASPCRAIKLPALSGEKIVPLSTKNVQDLVDVLPERYKLFAIFMGATGLRPSEARGVTWDRLDLERGTVLVDRQLVSTKTEPLWGPPKTAASYRRVKIKAKTIALLRQHRAPNSSPADLVFTSEAGSLTRGMLGATWRRARAKIPALGKGWHDLRHYHASLLIADGRSPVAVAHRLGHKDAHETLATYAHLWHDDDDLSAEATDGLLVLTKPETPSDLPEKT